MKIMRCIALLLCCLLLCPQAKAQQEFDSLFAKHLMRNKQYTDLAVYLLNQTNGTAYVNDLKVKTAYAIYRQVSTPDSFLQNFLSNQLSNPTYPNEQLSATAQTMQKVYRLQKQFNNTFPGDTISYIALTNAVYYNTYLALLNRDTFNYHRFIVKWDTVQYYNAYVQLQNWYKVLTEKNTYKPWKAAALSALLPGSGKVYVRKPLQGLASFMGIAALSLQTAEGYRHQGWHSPQFYVYAALGTLFYFGNIYGSAYSAAVSQHKKDAYYNQLLLVALGHWLD